MSKKKNSSCMGLFLKGFIISSLVLVNVAALSIMVGIKFMGFDATAWTDITAWNTRPFILLYICLTVSAGIGFLFSLAGAAVSAIFGGGDKKSSSGPKKRAKPQSNRRTTI